MSASLVRRSSIVARLAEALRRHLGSPWRRVLLLAVLPLAIGAALTIAFWSSGGAWLEIGTGLIGGSVIGLVFAVVQHTLDTNAADRQSLESVRFTVSSTSDLSGIDLSSADLTETFLRRKQFRSARLDGADLSEADLRETDLTGASFVGSTLVRADLQTTDLAGANLHHADLQGASLRDSTLDLARFTNADLSRADLTGAAATSLGMSRAVLEGAVLTGATLGQLSASFVEARVLDVSRADLAGSDFSCAQLGDACLTGADLRGADFSGADLRGAVLSDADLRGTRFVGAILRDADLHGVRVDDATDFARADLAGASIGRDVRSKLARSESDLHGPTVRRSEPAPPLDGAAPGAGGPSGVLVTSALLPAHDVAEAVQLVRRRRRALDERNAALVHDADLPVPPYWGSAGSFGLPARARAGSARPRRDDVRVEVRAGGEGAVSVLARHPGGRTAEVEVPQGELGVAELAAAIQLVTCEPGSFCTFEAIDALSRSLDDRSIDRETLSEHVAAAFEVEPENAVVLLLRSWLADEGDTTGCPSRSPCATRSATAPWPSRVASPVGPTASSTTWRRPSSISSSRPGCSCVAGTTGAAACRASGPSSTRPTRHRRVRTTAPCRWPWPTGATCSGCSSATAARWTATTPRSVSARSTWRPTRSGRACTPSCTSAVTTRRWCTPRRTPRASRAAPSAPPRSAGRPCTPSTGPSVAWA